MRGRGLRFRARLCFGLWFAGRRRARFGAWRGFALGFRARFAFGARIVQAFRRRRFSRDYMSALKITGPGRGNDAWASMVDGCELVAIRAGRVGVLFLRSRSLDVMLVSE